jgi:prepilin-type N-terminal cleavage/methylation domain-containing protein
MRVRAGQGGVTLLEMMVVMAILALAAGALTIGYARLPQTALKREAVRVASVLRSAYDRATASGAHHRVLLDLVEGSYMIERCEGRVQVRKSRDLAEEAERLRTDAEKAAQLAETQSPDQLLQAMVADVGKKVGTTASCEPVSGPLGKKQTLGGTPKVTFSKVHVAHLEQPARAGRVTLNFFPLGTAERAVIVLGVGEEAHFSLAVHPLSGRIEMSQGEWRDVEELLREDAEGREAR